MRQEELPLSQRLNREISPEEMREAYEASAFKRQGYSFERAMETQSFRILLAMRASLPRRGLA